MEESLLKQMEILPDAGDLAGAEAAARDTVQQLCDSIDELERRIQETGEAQGRKEQLDDRIPRGEKELSRLEERYAAAKVQMASADASGQSLAEQITALQEKLTFDSKDSAVAYRKTLEQERKALQTALETAEKNHASCKERLTSLRARIQQLKQQLKQLWNTD